MSETRGMLIYAGEDYNVRAYGHGSEYQIINVAGDSVWLQDEEAYQFGSDINNTSEAHTQEDVCSEWFNACKTEVL